MKYINVTPRNPDDPIAKLACQIMERVYASHEEVARWALRQTMLQYPSGAWDGNPVWWRCRAGEPRMKIVLRWRWA